MLCVDQLIDCQQEKEKRSYRRFVKVVIGIIILALLLVLFGKVGVFMLVFVLRVNVFHVINYVVVLYVNYPQCGDCALSASFIRECSDVSCAHTMCVCNQSLFYCKCTGFTVCFTCNDILLSMYINQC